MMRVARLAAYRLDQSKLSHDISSEVTSKLIIGRQEPTTIQVTFKPKTAALYQATFYFDVAVGESFSVCLLEGERVSFATFNLFFCVN